MRTALARELRSQLEKTVIKARDIAELAAREELQRLAVGDKTPADYLTEEQRDLRRSLRAHGRQLGDYRKPEGAKNAGEQGIEHLVTEVAYEHWHRMLFARFLAENNLLMYKDGVTALAIQDCFELAEEETGDSSNGWHYAANYAARMLPQIFRIDSPVFAINLAPNHQKQLEQLLSNLAQQTFQASDSLGWVYQFWQSKRKEQINKSEVKIGADELSAVTQLFTEPYMVSFLLDNSLGAWWVSNHPEIECPIELTYLRTLEDGSPAAGRFEGWPKQLKDLKTLDPCCGSGHFLVAAFLMLVPMRMAVENLSASAAVDAVLRDNIHGLELDQRCVELAAFALALEAWRYPDAGGYRALPELQIACSGLGINTKKEEWLALAEGNPQLEGSLDQLHDLFKQAPTLGSLIDPNKVKSDLFTADYSQAVTLFQEILAKNNTVESHEAGVLAQGMAKAASLLAGQYHWVITNVPYRSSNDLSEVVRNYSDKYFYEGKSDLATVFLLRILDFLKDNGNVSIVIPQNWLVQPTYKDLRKKILTCADILSISRLGAGAFQEITGEVVNVLLLSLNKSHSLDIFYALDCGRKSEFDEKANRLKNQTLIKLSCTAQKSNPDHIIFLNKQRDGLDFLANYASSVQGIKTGEDDRYKRKFWELCVKSSDWIWYQSTASQTSYFGGLEHILYWGKDGSHLARKQGLTAWGKLGIAVSQMSSLPCSIYLGGAFDSNMTSIVVNEKSDYIPLLNYGISGELSKDVREFDHSLKPTNSSFEKVLFDKYFWLNNGEIKTIESVPKLYSDDPTQCICHGQPAQSNESLQVAVTRLLGYRWPAETDGDMEMELSEETHTLIEMNKILATHVDDDGIVCLSAVRGEKPAHERMEQLLQAAYGSEWSTHVRNQLLEQVGCKNNSLELWLREKFFEQHCKLFQHRPFIWQLWDGLKDGFSVLVNYHKLDKKKLERLIYTYLDDWIRTQNLQQAEGVDGATERLAAAENLKKQLELILEGEAPYDIFVRWKPLEQQPIGWDPDLNDGVRLNIRPFMTVTDVGQKGAGILRTKPNIKWTKDRGKDVESAPWYKLGLEYGGKEGDRINDHHLRLEEKHLSSQDTDL